MQDNDLLVPDFFTHPMTVTRHPQRSPPSTLASFRYTVSNPGWETHRRKRPAVSLFLVRLAIHFAISLR